MAKFTYTNGKPEVEDFLLDLASEAADANIAYWKKQGANYENVDEDEVKSKYVDRYYNFLKNKLEGGSFDEKAQRQLEAFTGEDARKWHTGQGADPFAVAEKAEADKWANVAGLDESGAPLFFSMSSADIADDALSKGYQFGDPKERKAYMAKLTEYANLNQRANIAKEATEGVFGKGTAILFPGLMKVAQEGIMNPDKEVTKGDLAKAAALDVATNGAMVAAPSLNVFKGAPLVNSALGAAGQGAAEFVRQAGSDKIAGNDVNLSEAATSGGVSAGIGLTAPSLLGAAAGVLSPLPGMGRLQSGLMRGFKSSNPVAQERNAVVQSVKNADKKAKGVLGGMKASPATLKMESDAARGATIGELLGVGTDAKKAGLAYDLLSSGKGKLNPNKTIAQLTDADREEIAKFMQAFPAAANELGLNKDFARSLGIVIADVGGRVEPVLQGLPYKGTQRATDYKDQPWYAKMDKKQRALLDTAFKKKKDESED